MVNCLGQPVVSCSVSEEESFNVQGDRIMELWHEYGNKFAPKGCESNGRIGTSDPVLSKCSTKTCDQCTLDKLREAIEGTKDYIGVSGVYNLTSEDHNGLGTDSMILVRIDNGKWSLVK